MMLLSLISLTDAEIELVTSAVREWCRLHHCDIDSADGRRTLTIAIDLVQSQPLEEHFTPELIRRLVPTTYSAIPVAQCSSDQ
jgi:hypothetical protein